MKQSGDYNIHTCTMKQNIAKLVRYKYNILFHNVLYIQSAQSYTPIFSFHGSQYTSIGGPITQRVPTGMRGKKWVVNGLQDKKRVAKKIAKSCKRFAEVLQKVAEDLKRASEDLKGVTEDLQRVAASSKRVEKLAKSCRKLAKKCKRFKKSFRKFKRSCRRFKRSCRRFKRSCRRFTKTCIICWKKSFKGFAPKKNYSKNWKNYWLAPRAILVARIVPI